MLFEPKRCSYAFNQIFNPKTINHYHTIVESWKLKTVLFSFFNEIQWNFILNHSYSGILKGFLINVDQWTGLPVEIHNMCLNHKLPGHNNTSFWLLYSQPQLFALHGLGYANPVNIVVVFTVNKNKILSFLAKTTKVKELIKKKIERNENKDRKKHKYKKYRRNQFSLNDIISLLP